MILIAKFKEANPNGVLILHLVDHLYLPNKSDAKALFEDFMQIMKDNKINVTIIANDTGVKLANIEGNKGFQLVIGIHSDFENYLQRAKNPPTILTGIDLDFHQDQHQMLYDFANQANAKSFISVDKYMLASEELAPALSSKHQLQ